MDPETKLGLIQAYLRRRLSFEKMVLAVIEQGGEHEEPARIHNIKRELLEDIINDIDALVK